MLSGPRGIGRDPPISLMSSDKEVAKGGLVLSFDSITQRIEEI